MCSVLARLFVYRPVTLTRSCAQSVDNRPKTLLIPSLMFSWNCGEKGAAEQIPAKFYSRIAEISRP
ncbi:hypothetical protein SAMN05444279_11777 [Ruegeria intermedia]|uniref:Uncharacterized protein n=1 Tax=Ruegeria intermedia TaxID=996115 RepID=A0A1M4Z081_9RHOB|nr:hypothetical protein SAMN05444279_11777 [Ruegeria intermedia]